MGNNSEYKRSFFIFQCEDMIFKGFTSPSGYLRVIQNGPQSKALLDLSNFEIDSSKAYHELIFIFNHPNRPEEFPIFTSFKIRAASGRVMEEFTFNTYDVGGSGMTLRDLWGIVIYTQIIGESSLREYFPLKSIKQEDRPWKNMLLNKMKKKNKTYMPHKNPDDKITESVPDEIDEETVGKNSREFVKRAVEQIFKQTIDPQPKQEYKMPVEDTGDNDEFSNDNPLEKLLERIASKDELPPKNDKDTLFDEHFEKYDPFGTTNHQYRWWKCKDMHKVNEVLLGINIGIPFELNKDGYIACEAYGHVVVGLYSDRKTSRDFVVLGIPAENKEAPGNYHNNSRWENSEEGYTPAGYWLTYIDMKTSNVVKAAY